MSGLKQDVGSEYRALRRWSGEIPVVVRRCSCGGPAVLLRWSGGGPAVVRRLSRRSFFLLLSSSLSCLDSLL
ncbi:hypothetical protein MA16_Dca005526 [Dendrobium catenatum]|uniref:Uncharacterized protein n=1 Tax=Dendrobium catenatum TaxID=906689 RepID=A0A2I0WPV3_9ASPA|nr:hypothetical protein MA16_Dca005526 [Dendrobium catenatum]